MMKVDKGNQVGWEKSCTCIWSRNSIAGLNFKSRCWKGKARWMLRTCATLHMS